MWERAALVALLHRSGTTWSDVALDVQEAGSATALLDRRCATPDALFSTETPPTELIRTSMGEIAGWQADGIAVRAFFDDGYPAQLLGIKEVPPVLFTRGEAWAHDRAIAVVGSRDATEEGLRTARAVAAALVGRGVTVASGLAKGIDTAAHTAALDTGGRTVAILGTGIRRYYPADNRALQDRITREGLVISQFWPGAPPTKQSFPMRNATTSGYSTATVIVEAGETSGARIQARLALQHGRLVVLTSQVMRCTWAQSFARNPGVFVVDGLAPLLDVIDEILGRQPTPTGLEEFPGLALR